MRQGYELLHFTMKFSYEKTKTKTATKKSLRLSH